MIAQPTLIPQLIDAVAAALVDNADTIAELDQAIGDGDHLTNLQRGVDALLEQRTELGCLTWDAAFQKIGMTLLSRIGGAAGSLLGSLFLGMGKAVLGREMTAAVFAECFTAGVAAVKQRGKSDVGEKTMLDVLVPVAETLEKLAVDQTPTSEILAQINQAAQAGAEATRNMLPIKGRASFLGERALGHVDPGAKSSQVMIAAVTKTLASE